MRTVVLLIWAEWVINTISINSYTASPEFQVGLFYNFNLSPPFTINPIRFSLCSIAQLLRAKKVGFSTNLDLPSFSYISTLFTRLKDFFLRHL
jgi:hypothetical protein